MAREVIPWHVFLEALHKQPEAELGKWLARWRYTNEGAILKFKPVKAEDNLRRATKQYQQTMTEKPPILSTWLSIRADT